MTLTVEQYKDSITNALSENQIELLKVLYNFPNSTASAKDLASALGFKSFHATNSQVEQIGKIIAKHLGVEPNLYWDGREERPAYFLFVGPNAFEQGKIRGTEDGWEMVENLRKAIESLQPTTTSNSYLFVWNPKRWDWENLEDDIEQVELTGKTKNRWSCGNTKSIQVGDRIFLVKLGTEPKGIIAAGFATTTPFEEKHWTGENRQALYIDIDFDVLLNSEKEPILTLDILKTGNLAKQYSWTPQASGISILPEIVDELEAVWFDFLRTHNIRRNPFIPTIDNSKKTFIEGTVNQVLQTRYERNPYARKACVTHYGYSCKVCDFNFEKHYGHLGKNFIHVHHLIQVAIVGKTYEVDPIKDLRPVCPNCHSMLHKQTPPLTIEELISLLG